MKFHNVVTYARLLRAFDDLSRILRHLEILLPTKGNLLHIKI